MYRLIPISVFLGLMAYVVFNIYASFKSVLIALGG